MLTRARRLKQECGLSKKHRNGRQKDVLSGASPSRPVISIKYDIILTTCSIGWAEDIQKSHIGGPLGNHLEAMVL